jgi:peptide-methionine (S)-S-oxide reductase
MFSFGHKSQLPDPADALRGRAEPLPTAERHFINGLPLKGPYPPGSEIIDFAFGCFWGAEKDFWQIPGVIVTAVGY